MLASLRVPLLLLLALGSVACTTVVGPTGEKDAGGADSGAADASIEDAGALSDAGVEVDGDAGADAGMVDAIVLPPINRPLWLGYFKVSGRYGDFTLEATRDAGNCACVFANQGDFDIAIQDPVMLTAKAAADLATLGAGIVIAGGTAEISAAVPYWSQVVSLYVTGEATGSSPLDSSSCEQQAAVARAHLQSLALPNRPIICYYDTDISTDPTNIWHDPVGVDWVGINACLGPAAPTTTAVAIAALRDLIRRQLARLPANRSVIIMAQAYDRNGAWTDTPILEQLQPIYLEEAQLDLRIKGIWWFSYSRPGATLTFPSLRPWHAAVFRANVMGRPPIEVPP